MPHNFRFRALQIALVLALFTFFCPPAKALTIDAEVGHNGFYLPGKWTPVTVTVENLPRADKARQKLEPFDGYVEVLSQPAAGNSRPVSFSRALNVPVNDRKRVTLYTKMSALQADAEVVLINKSGKRIETKAAKRTAVGKGVPLILAVGTTDINPSFFPIEGLEQPQVSLVDPADLPDKWYGYDGVGLLIIPRATEALLQADRMQAIQKWVAQGGNVLLLGGRYATSYRDSQLQEMSPVEYVASNTYTLTDEGVAPADPATSGTAGMLQIDEVKPKQGSTLAYSRNAIPLLYQKPYDSGTVYYLCTDWNNAVLRHFQVQKMLHTKLASQIDFTAMRERFDTDFLYGNQQHFGLGTANMLPNSGLVALILFSYFLLVGPINFYVLAKKKRLELAWITVPAIVIVYTGAIYALSSHIKGDDSIMRTYHLLTGKANARTARAETLSMVFLPNVNTHRFDAPGEDVADSSHAIWVDRATPYAYNFRGSAPTIDEGVRVDQGPKGMVIPAKLVPQWAPDFCRFDSLADLGGPVEATVSFDGTRCSGVIRNATAHQLRTPHLFFNGRMWSLMEDDGIAAANDQDTAMPAGASLEFSIDTKSQKGQSLSGFAFGTEELNRKASEQFITCISTQGTVVFDSPPCMLLAQTDFAPVKVEFGNQLTKRSSHTFIALQCDVKLSAGEHIILENDNISKLVVNSERGNYWMDPRQGNVQLKDGHAVFSYSMPAFDRQQAEFDGRFTFAPNDLGKDLKLFAFNTSTYNWDQIGFNMERAGASEDEERNRTRNTGGGVGAFRATQPGFYLHPITKSLLLRVSYAPGAKKNFNFNQESLQVPVLSSVKLIAMPKEQQP